jgi:hypothetical protein
MAAQFIRQLGALKVKEVPDFLARKLSAENVTRNATTFMEEYRVRYINTGSPAPIFHVLGGVFTMAYITCWPAEYRHMVAAREGKH